MKKLLFALRQWVSYRKELIDQISQVLDEIHELRIENQHLLSHLDIRQKQLEYASEQNQELRKRLRDFNAVEWGEVREEILAAVRMKPNIEPLEMYTGMANRHFITPTGFYKAYDELVASGRIVEHVRMTERACRCMLRLGSDMDKDRSE